MGRQLAISAAAWVAVIGFFHSSTLAQIRQTMQASPATKPVHDPADVPVKEVVLFSSGVGYFEHAGTVNGDAATELRFKTDQVNDILKSLLLQDMDGGTIGTVSYPGLAPLAHTLKSFQVDITANPDMADLLNQLRGAKLTVTTDLNQPITGIILGVEKKLRPAGDKGAFEETKLNLKSGRLFHSILLDQVRTIELEDPTLQKELDDALAALTKARDQDKKPMTLHFNGKGARHVRIGYLVETPIWKTSYRLVFEPADAKGSTTAPSHAPTTRPLGLNDGLPHPAKIQGWAIVENQTDNNWNDVSLSLVSGRPLSFIQDLYHAQYIPRPVVQADNHASLRPQTYAGGIYDIKDIVANVPDFTDAPDFSLNSTSNNQQQKPRGGGGGGGLFSGGEGKESMSGKDAAQQNTQQPIDPTSSIVSAATAAKVGELFKYRVGNVSLARQTSAMIPIINDDIHAERVSIYNAAMLVSHPLLGARVRNNTKKYLLQGPLTVLDRGSYAGDARIDDLPPGQERLISFGIDQQLLMDATDIKQSSAVVTGRIAKGIMILTTKNVTEQTYVADNRSDETRVLILEHPRQPEFKLVTPPQAEETTGDVFRFRRSIPAHQTSKIAVAEEHVVDSSIQIVMFGSAEISVFVKNPAIPQNVRDALMKELEIKNQMLTLDARISELHRQKDELAADQGRVRDNLKAVSGESDYYKRLMKKMDGQESDIEKIQKSLAETQQLHQSAEKQLSDYITGLTVP